jgi:hypothetical protein
LELEDETPELVAASQTFHRINIYGRREKRVRRGQQRDRERERDRDREWLTQRPRCQSQCRMFWFQEAAPGIDTKSSPHYS